MRLSASPAEVEAYRAAAAAARPGQPLPTRSEAAARVEDARFFFALYGRLPTRYRDTV